LRAKLHKKHELSIILNVIKSKSNKKSGIV